MPGLPGSRKAATGKIQNSCKDHEQPVLSDGIRLGWYKVMPGKEIVYVGIGPENGKKVRQSDAFMYAMERCTTDPADMQDFCNYFTGIRYGKTNPEELAEFRNELVKWFYSGNWIEEEEDVKKL